VETNTPTREALESRITYTFQNPELFAQALQHRTFVHEQRDPNLKDNQRLEFLGDAVLGLTIGHFLMENFPAAQEGDLTRMRANLVNESHLAKLAQFINLGPHIKLGKGEILTHGREKDSILADAMEALIAAIYLDGGYEAAVTSVRHLFHHIVNEIDRDYKSKLQEHVQKDQHAVPQYAIIAETGPDHDKTFRVAVRVCGVTAEGTGKSKKRAEQSAAKKALSLLDTPAELPHEREQEGDPSHKAP
jgi:ribonuclease III